MSRYFTRGNDSKWFAKIDEENTFIREYKHQVWRYWGKTSHFIVAVKKGYWKEITAAEAGDLKYADCSQCAENWPELFDYHPDGYLVSKVKRGWGAHVLNVGDAVRGTINKYNKQKYLQIRVNGKNYHLHRIVYEMFNGPIPDGYVIKNADDSCAKIENLELISLSKRQAISKFSRTSGIRGVCWCKTRNRWDAKIKVKGVDHYLGRFDNINEAINARILGEIRYYGKQINEYPDYISPEEAERIKQRYYEGDAMKQIEINTEPPEPPAPEPAPEFEYNTFRFRKRDIRINSNNYINLVDLFRAMRGGDSEQFRQQIASFEQVAVFDHFVNIGEDYDAEYFAPPLMAQMFAQRLGSACDGVELIATYHAYCNVMMAAGEQADSKEVENLNAELAALKQENSGQQATISRLLADKAKADAASAEQTERDANAVASAQQKVDDLENQNKELKGLLDAAREDRDNYKARMHHWQKQYKQANKAFGDEQGERQKLEGQIDNLLKTNSELRHQRDNNNDAKAKAAADKQTIDDLRADLEEANETIKDLRQEVNDKKLVIRGYQLKVAELEEDKAELQRNVNHLQDENNQLADHYNKLIARNLQRRAAQKRYMGDLHREHVTDAIEWMQAIKAAGDWHQRRQQRQQQRYRKLIMALQDKVKELLYRLDKKPESGFFNKVKNLFHH